MTATIPSYQKVFYDLRPAKQVERKMILDTLQQLAGAGLPLYDYQYTGMGAIYFVDFILLHKLLGLRNLLSVEKTATDERRVRFNKPFRDINIEIGTIGDVLPQLDRDRRHLVWLDYDHRLSPSDLQDLVLATEILPLGSIILMTIDVEPPDHGDTPEKWCEYYNEVGRDFVPFDVTVENFSKSSLGHTNARILANAIRQGIVARKHLTYFPLFSFLYADGHQMLTIGGLLGGDAEERLLNGSRVVHSPFIRRDADALPFEIKVPRLTRKERIYLDQHMPCDDNWTPSDFDLPSDEIAQYRAIYRYYPMYGELLI
jgi:hypothetical protein